MFYMLYVFLKEKQPYSFVVDFLKKINIFSKLNVFITAYVAPFQSVALDMKTMLTGECSSQFVVCKNCEHSCD